MYSLAVTSSCLKLYSRPARIQRSLWGKVCFWRRHKGEMSQFRTLLKSSATFQPVFIKECFLPPALLCSTPPCCCIMDHQRYSCKKKSVERWNPAPWVSSERQITSDHLFVVSYSDEVWLSVSNWQSLKESRRELSCFSLSYFSMMEEAGPHLSRPKTLGTAESETRTRTQPETTALFVLSPPPKKNHLLALKRVKKTNWSGSSNRRAQTAAHQEEKKWVHVDATVNFWTVCT